MSVPLSPVTFRDGGIPKAFTVLESYPEEYIDRTLHFSSEAVLPGHGASGDDCGQGIAYYCNQCGQPFWTTSKCMQRTCPDCYERWAAKEAGESSARVAWGAKVLRNRLLASGITKRPRLVHVVVSVRDRGTVEELRREAYAVARSHGMTGGCCVFHPFRRDRYDGQYTLQDCVHFHIVGFTPKDMGQGGTDEDLESAFEYLEGRMMDLPLIFMNHRNLTDWGEVSEGKKDEWIERIVLKSINRTKPFFKHIEDDEYKDYRGLRSGRAIKRCLQYVLTHAGIIEGTHALTYWGTMSYRSLSESAINKLYPGALDQAPELNPECPVCGSRDTEPCEQFEREEILREQHGYMGGAIMLRQTITNHAPPDWETGRLGPHALQWEFILWEIASGPKTLDDILLHLDPDDGLHELLCQVVDWNLATGRLLEGRDRKLWRAPTEFCLDHALNVMRFIKSTEGGDAYLRRLIERYPPVENEVMTDEGFVFGPTIERLSREK